MRSSTSTWSKGLVRKSDAPTSSAWCLVSIVTSAVSTRMGRQSSGEVSCASWRMTSKPLMCGIIRSSSTRSGRNSW